MPEQNLRIALVQTNLVWEDKVANLANLEEKLWSITEGVDLIILPEMFPTGFSMNAEKLAEPMNFHATKWMKQMAGQKKCVITGSLIIQEGDDFFNRMLWVTPEGDVDFYDKRHLFRMAKEDETFSPGLSKKIFELKSWKILPQVCYDLRFPVFSRNKWKDGKSEYDLSIYIASWPAARSSAWETLLPARAIENLSYSIGVNRVGTDGNGIAYKGKSAAYDFKGQALVEHESEEVISIIELDAKALGTYRQKFPAWQDADQFSIRDDNMP
ncbi:amidohydrolase [Algoriphagus sediminis]|uniref:Amidohydrolase n=1 Tax=Algoriphagus sediminis TaxID=3057113 RepID=A0ABT7YHA9_9BACT|nr:amidohydrolase [Algoriphagus sediminis]MDN3205858.1 amidohydrolase [Algoriphagus sediminis]